jgi:hypothetical protein
MTVVDCAGLTVRQVNQALRRLIGAGEREIAVRHPAARHNLAVAILSDGAQIEIHGSAGWGVAEGLLSGTVVVDGHAGNAAAASIRGGEVVVRGDAAARAGIAMKGGLLVIGGSAGYMTGFMMQRGTIVVCGDAAEGIADSMSLTEIAAKADFYDLAERDGRLPTAWRLSTGDLHQRVHRLFRRVEGARDADDALAGGTATREAVALGDEPIPDGLRHNTKLIAGDGDGPLAVAPGSNGSRNKGRYEPCLPRLTFGSLLQRSSRWSPVPRLSGTDILGTQITSENRCSTSARTSPIEGGLLTFVRP